MESLQDTNENHLKMESLQDTNENHRPAAHSEHQCKMIRHFSLKKKRCLHAQKTQKHDHSSNQLPQSYE